jgi:hypothetical protein
MIVSRRDTVTSYSGCAEDNATDRRKPGPS